MTWRVRALNATVDGELDALPADTRALYVTAAERQVVVVRAFVKKTRRTPRREIELALRRAREVSQ